MNKQIQDLPNLSQNNLDINSDFLIVQKPNADTYKMSVKNAYKTSLSSLVMFDDEIIVDSWANGTTGRKSYQTNPVVDQNGNQITSLNVANFVYCSILQVGQAYPRLGFSYFSSLNSDGVTPENEVYFDLSYYDRAKEDTWYFLIPILNNNIELNISVVYHGNQFTQFKFHGYC